MGGLPSHGPDWPNNRPPALMPPTLSIPAKIGQPRSKTRPTVP
jgi:hypothetical protein